MKLFVIGSIFFLLACNGQKKATNQSNTPEKSELKLLVEDYYAGAQVPENSIIKDEKNLNYFFSKINMTRKPGIAVPTVDFTKEMVVISCSGKRTDGAKPTLKVAEVTASQYILSIEHKSAEKQNSNSVSYPFCLYKMPLTDKEVVFNQANK